MLLFLLPWTMFGSRLFLQTTTTRPPPPLLRHNRFLFVRGLANTNDDVDVDKINNKSEMLTREREVFRILKPELRQGYRWLQRLERNEPLLKKRESKTRTTKPRKKKKKKNKGKNKKKKKGRSNSTPWVDYFDREDYSCHRDYFDNPIPENHVLIGKIKKSFKLTAADIDDLLVIKQPNPYKSTYSDLQWVNVNEAAEIASTKYGGSAGFLDRLIRSAGVKNKRKKSKSSNAELQKLKESSNNANLLRNAMDELRDKYRLPLYTNDVESIRSLNRAAAASTATASSTSLNDRSIEAFARRHFLMTFTEFPLIRNERSSLLMWISRFPQGVDEALEFEALPNGMHTEVETLWNEFFLGDTTRTQKDKIMPIPEQLETVDHQYNTTMLEAIDEASRERAQRFIDLGLPNAAEAKLVEDTMNGEFPSFTSSFPFLFRVEWVPASGSGQGDLVFANRDGTRFAVVEAKANTKNQTSKVNHVKQQSAFYADRLRSELHHTSHQVYAGYVTDEGFSWLSENPEDVIETAAVDSDETRLRPSNELIPDSTSQPAKSVSVEVDHIPNTLTFESRRKELDAMTIRGGLEELLTKYALPKTGRKAELIDRILKVEDIPDTLTFESRHKELDAMTIRGGLRELLTKYDLPKTGRKAELIDQILKHEGVPQPSGGDDHEGLIFRSGSSTVTPSRREQLEAMNIEHELKALCHLYGVRPDKRVKQDYVEAVWLYETTTPGISAGF